MQLMEIIPTIFPEAVINIIVGGEIAIRKTLEKKGQKE